MKSNILTYIALFVGVTLLLFSLQLYLSTYAVMNNKQMAHDKFEYLVVNKNITNQMMGNSNISFFTQKEIDELKKISVVKNIGLIESNQFAIEASNFGELAFSTQLFFESIPKEYLDIQPDNFAWQPGHNTVPVILSQDFLNLYNFGFALSQGLPQMSEETVKAISFNLQIASQENFVAEVVGFSQRYSSVVVPSEFMQYANKKYGNNQQVEYARLVLQTEEPDNPELVKYLKEKNYSTQNDKIKWSKVKSIVNTVFASSGLLGIFILALCIMLLVLYLNLVMAKSADKLKLLSLLGYKTEILQRHFVKPVFFAFVFIVLLALFTTQILHFLLSQYLKSYQLFFSTFISWQTIATAFLLLAFVYFLFSFKSKKILNQYFE